MFPVIESYRPKPVAVVNGGILAILLLVGVSIAIGQGGRVRAFFIGAQRPGAGLIPVSRASMTPAKLNTAVTISSPPEDPLKAIARTYFRMVRVLEALDQDQDLKISSWEMITAPAALRKLDLDGDGRLTAEECGFQPRAEGLPSDVAIRARREFMRVNPVLAALDLDRDGEISAAEIARASNSLKTLDRNRDGSLTPDELLPDRAENSAAMIMARFDRNDDGVLSPEEAEPLRGLLPGSAPVTREELLHILRRRMEAASELDRARRTIGAQR
jgi:Ca2+-binding EF-hand superfamily protein